MDKKISRILFLDWLRVFAFSSVLIGHKFYDSLEQFSQNDAIHESLRSLVKLLLPFCYGGGAGVVVFFLVSGYVIIHVLQKEPPLEFLIKRIFRIYPLYIAAVLLQYSLSKIPIIPQVLIQQLLLVGDFFDSPHTLYGVEWTLRLEVLFYALMLCLRKTKIIGTYEYLLPWIIIALTFSLVYMPSLPGKNLPNHGYVNIYAPFLFLGMFFWLYEYNRIDFKLTSAFTFFVLVIHWHLIDTQQPDWRHTHFAILGVFLFILAWTLRKRIVSHYVIFYLSELTYSVYLLHCLVFDVIKKCLTWLGIQNHHSILSLAALIFICTLLVKGIEKPGIKLGQALILFIRRTMPLLNNITPKLAK